MVESTKKKSLEEEAHDLVVELWNSSTPLFSFSNGLDSENPPHGQSGLAPLPVVTDLYLHQIRQHETYHKSIMVILSKAPTIQNPRDNKRCFPLTARQQFAITGYLTLVDWFEQVKISNRGQRHLEGLVTEDVLDFLCILISHMKFVIDGNTDANHYQP